MKQMILPVLGSALLFLIGHALEGLAFTILTLTALLAIGVALWRSDTSNSQSPS